jgi:peptide/nickel transport system substrate-binding protein
MRWRCLLLLAALLALSIAGPSGAADKTFVYALYGEPETLDSAKMESERALHPAWLMCDALVNLSREGTRLEPGLAESWTASPDGSRVVLKLRAGVLFHDGTAMDAKAVKASFERQFRPDHPLYTSAPRNTKEQLLQELVDDIQAPDTGTVVFKLKYPGLHYLSQIDVISPTAAARLGADFGRQPVCSGPFAFQSWSNGQIVMSANARYWGGRPRIDRVVFRSVDEPKAIVDALIKREADFTPTLSETIYFERVRGSARVSLVPVAGLNLYYMGFYTDRPPFNDVRLRRAVAQAINVPRMAVFLGRGAAVAAKGPLPPAVLGYDPSISQIEHDPRAARELLAQSGHPSGLTASLVYPGAVTLQAEIAGAIQHDLRRVSINVELQGKPNYPELTRAMRAGEGNMFLYSWHVRGAYPERILIPLFQSRSVGATNFTRYSNPVLDELLEQGLRLPAGPVQQQLYSKIQKLIVADAPMVFLYHATRMAAVGGWVQGLELNLGAKPHDKLVKVDVTP